MAACTLLLQGCGNSDADGDSAAAAEVASRQALVKASYRPDIRSLTLSWTDPFSVETGLRIERLVAGSWTLVQALPADVVTWSGSYAEATSYRVVAVLPAGNVVLKSATGQSELRVLDGLELTVSPESPLRGTVSLGVKGIDDIQRVSYGYIDASGAPSALSTVPFGGESRPADAYWQINLPNGPQTLWTRVETRSATTVELRKAVAVDVVAVLTSFGLDRTTAATTGVGVYTTAAAGVASVEVIIDGRLIGKLVAPTACRPPDPCGTDPAAGNPTNWHYYGFTLPDDVPARVYLATVRVTDGNGVVSTFVQALDVNRLPVLELDSPVPGAMVKGDVHVLGRVSDDSGSVTIAVSFDEQPAVYQGTAGTIDLVQSLAGLSPGLHRLRVLARDASGLERESTRVISVAAPGDLGGERVASLGEAGRLLAASQGYVLAYNTQGSLGPRLERRRTGTPDRVDVLGGVRPAVAPVRAVMSGPRVISTDPSTPEEAAATGQANQLRYWGADGIQRNLTRQLGVEAALGRAPLAGPWLALLNPGESPAMAVNQVLNLDSAATFELQVAARIVDDAGQATRGVAVADLGTHAAVFFPKTVYVGARSFTYTEAFDTATLNISVVSQFNYPYWTIDDLQTDGQRVVWRIWRLDPPRVLDDTDTSDLWTANVSRPFQNVLLGANATGPVLAEGLVAWFETSGGVTALKVNDGAATTVLSDRVDAAVAGLSVGGGAVAWASNGQLFVWTPGKGVRVVLSTEASTGSAVTGFVLVNGWVYFTRTLAPPLADREVILYRAVL